MKQPKQEWEEKFDKIWKHSPSYPVVGGSKVCDNCGEINYETECCSITVDWNVEETKHFISSLLLSQRKEVIKDIIEEINTTNIENRFGLDEDLVESIKILLITKINKLK